MIIKKSIILIDNYKNNFIFPTIHTHDSDQKKMFIKTKSLLHQLQQCEQKNAVCHEYVSVCERERERRVTKRGHEVKIWRKQQKILLSILVEFHDLFVERKF